MVAVREERVVRWVVAPAKQLLRPQRVLLFGSRARQTHRPYSDYDFAIEHGQEPFTAKEWSAFINDAEDNAPTLSKLDIINFIDALNEALRAEIERTGLRVDIP